MQTNEIKFRNGLNRNKFIRTCSGCRIERKDKMLDKQRQGINKISERMENGGFLKEKPAGY